MSLTEVILRELQSSDLELLIAIERDPKNLVYSESDKTPEIVDLELFLNSDHNLLKHDQLRMVIEKKGIAVGFADFFDADFLHLNAYVGIIVLDEYRRKGIALAALHLLSEVALSYKLISLLAKCQIWNDASICLFQQAGFLPVSQDNIHITFKKLL